MQLPSRLVVPAVALLLAACSTQSEPPELENLELPNVQDESSSAPQEGVTGMTLDEDGTITSQTIPIEDGGMDADTYEDQDIPGGVGTGQGMTVYFGYDSTDVDPQFHALIERVAARLRSNSSASARLEGHTDERGTRTYNLALGERRAQSVLDMLLERNVLAEQIDWVSYGEEIPAAMGQGEEYWKQNRRVEIILNE